MRLTPFVVVVAAIVVYCSGVAGSDIAAAAFVKARPLTTTKSNLTMGKGRQPIPAKPSTKGRQKLNAATESAKVNNMVKDLKKMPRSRH